MFTFFNGCGIPPVTLTCPPGGQAQVQTAQGCSPPIIGPTGTQGCTQPGHCVGPTGTQGCTMPPNCLIGPTAYQGCHQSGGHAQAQTILPTWFGSCGIPPVTVTCNQGHAQAQTIGITGWYGCTAIGPTGTQGCGQGVAQAQAQFHFPTIGGICKTNTTIAAAQNVGPTGTQGCTIVGPTGTQGCGQGNAQAQTAVLTIVCPTVIQCGNAQAQTLGQTAYLGCHQQGTAATVCTQYGCDGGNAQAQTLGHTAYPGCDQAGTAATVCTQTGACGPTHLLGCTGYEGCHQPADAQTLGHTAYLGCGQAGTAATVCTQTGCDGGNAQAQIHSIPVADCIPTRSCTGVWPAC